MITTGIVEEKLFDKTTIHTFVSSTQSNHVNGER